MAPAKGSGRQKRARVSSGQDADEDNQDHASSAPTSTAKRRRLNGNESASTVPQGSFNAITSTIGSILGFGRRDSTKETTSNGEQNGAKGLAHDDDAASSDDEQESTKPQKPRRPAAVSYAKAGLKAPKATRQTPTKNIYDVPSSGDEFEVPTKMAAHSAAKSKEATPTTAGSARSRRSRAQDSEYETAPESASKVISSKGRGRPKVARLSSNPDESKGSLSTDEYLRRPAVKDLTARVAKPSRKPANASPAPPTPKGILTPRHKRPGRPRKSVVFDSDDNKPAAEVFFEDLPSTTKPSASRSTTKKIATRDVQAEVQQEEEQDDSEEEHSDDDEVCVICGNPDSKAPNEIIFCENCDKAFHQKCYGVPVIPEDDWFCKDCLQEDVVTGQNDLVTPGKESTPATVPDIANFEAHLQTFQRILIDRCTGTRRLKLKGQEEAYDKVYQLVEQTVLAGEGNSMMIIGARGCGKTLLTESVVSDLATENLDTFHVVRLNGFIHTDDKLALKEIWRQLGKEMDVEDEMNKMSNYADTLASLLALLSHPSEITGTAEGVTSKSVVFVIDEFDLFATHARQTLLYNLFDIAQAKKAPIAVLGLTTRIDVVESLEKRVKSRFSHRYVHLSLPKSLPAYWEICKQGLLVDGEDVQLDQLATSTEGFEEFREYWELKIEALRQTQSFQDHLEYHYYTTKSVAAFLTTCVLPLSSLSKTFPELKIPGFSLEGPDSKLQLLAALSDLDLALLISAARLDIVAHTDTVNFAMAYDEYSSQMGKQRVSSGGMLALGAGARVWGRAVAGMAWERLVSLGLLVPAGIGGKSNAAHGGLEGKMWKLDVALDEIPAAAELPGFLVRWCTQI